MPLTSYKFENESWWEKIQSYYWQTLPYNWRPGQIWYRLKCFCWHRYTTYKPRTLGHTWCDRTELLPHMIFEILARFLDKECSPGHIEWYGEHGHKVIPGVNYNAYTEEDRNHPDSVYVLDYMKELRSWFYDTYLNNYDDYLDEWYEFHKRHCIIEMVDSDTKHCKKMDFQYDTPENKEKDSELLQRSNDREVWWNQQLEEKMTEVIKLRAFMWT